MHENAYSGISFSKQITRQADVIKPVSKKSKYFGGL
jgi:hypothetical protein